jgi:hypothetical protein
MEQNVLGAMVGDVSSQQPRNEPCVVGQQSPIIPAQAGYAKQEEPCSLVGSFEGAPDGAVDGAPAGEVVGFPGVFDGSLVGSSEGAVDGALVGEFVFVSGVFDGE